MIRKIFGCLGCLGVTLLGLLVTGLFVLARYGDIALGAYKLFEHDTFQVANFAKFLDELKNTPPFSSFASDKLFSAKENTKALEGLSETLPTIFKYIVVIVTNPYVLVGTIILVVIAVLFWLGARGKLGSTLSGTTSKVVGGVSAPRNICIAAILCMLAILVWKFWTWGLERSFGATLPILWPIAIALAVWIIYKILNQHKGIMWSLVKVLVVVIAVLAIIGITGGPNLVNKSLEVKISLDGVIPWIRANFWDNWSTDTKTLVAILVALGVSITAYLFLDKESGSSGGTYMLGEG